MNKMWLLAAVAVLSLPLPVALADRPPADAKPLVEVVEQLERRGYGPFIEVSFDDGVWEVEVYKQDVQFELEVDAQTGSVRSEHRDDAEPRPPRDAQPLSRILHALMGSGHANLEDVSFERRYWEIEYRRQDGKREVHVHPTTGEIINDRPDD